MSSDPLKLKDTQAAEHYARWEAVETVKAQELAALTDERALEIIRSLSAVEGWRDRPDGSGLVEQQAIFQRSLAKRFACKQCLNLVIHKVFAGRDRDWGDVQSVLVRQRLELNLGLVRKELKPLLELKGQSDAMAKLDGLVATVKRRLQARN